MKIEKPAFIPEGVWDWLPAFPFEYPGIYGFLPLPRCILDQIASQEITLSAGSNTVTYTGRRQKASEAFASIVNYLVIAYHLNVESQSWEQVLTDTIMVPGDTYNINVSQDCVWRF